MAKKRAVTIAAMVMFAAVAILPGVRGGVSPATNTLTINAGSSGMETKTVTVPAVPAKADIEVAIDTTGSMGGAIAQAQTQAVDLVNAVQAQIADAQFSVVEFKDSFDTPEYAVHQSMTSDASAVQAAINGMSAADGGDFPEAYNLVFQNSYTPATGGAIGWRGATRKFVVVFGDAPPHGAVNDGYSECFDTSPDPHGLHANTELAGMEAAQRTLFMVASWEGIKPCYDQLTADAYTGSQAVNLGDDIAAQLVSLIQSASSSVSDVHLQVASASPAPANASWVSFNPPTAGPVDTPATLNFTVTVAVPAGTPGGTYSFDIMGLADGGDIGHQKLHVVVPGSSPPAATKLVAEPSIAKVLPGAKVNLTLGARLTVASTGAPLGGKTISFKVGTASVCNARTNANGVATCGGVIAAVRSVLSLGYAARFAGDDLYVFSSANGPLIVLNGTSIL